jgi:RimJ/RimL family protein N-acetyltransferase
LPIETERLVLRRFEGADFDALFAYRSRPDVARYIYWEAESPEEARVALDRKIASRGVLAEGDVFCLAIELKTTGQMIGDVVLQLKSLPNRTAELGYVLHPDHRGHGYATEASRELLRIAFEELRLHRVVAGLEARNLASARVLEKLGMRREARFVEDEFVKGEWQSAIEYAILDREWRATADPQPPAISS